MTDGFHVLIFFEAKPDKAGALGRVLIDLMAPSLAEPGCRCYEPFADFQHPEKLTVLEVWDNREQWEKHLQMPHVAKALSEISAEDILTRPFTAQQLRSIG
jgi:quinol monooxygenase YgiN